MLNCRTPAEGSSVKQILYPSATLVSAYPLLLLIQCGCAMNSQWAIRDNRPYVCFHVVK